MQQNNISSLVSLDFVDFKNVKRIKQHFAIGNILAIDFLIFHSCFWTEDVTCTCAKYEYVHRVCDHDVFPSVLDFDYILEHP